MTIKLSPEIRMPSKIVIKTTHVIVLFLIIAICIGLLLYCTYSKQEKEEGFAAVGACAQIPQPTVIKNLIIPNLYDKGTSATTSPDTKKRYLESTNAISNFKREVGQLDRLSCNSYWTYMDKYASEQGFMEKSDADDDGQDEYTITGQGKFEALQIHGMLCATYLRMLSSNAEKPNAVVQTRILKWINEMFNMCSGIYIARNDNRHKDVAKRNRPKRDNNQLMWYLASAIIGVYINGSISPLNNGSKVIGDSVTGPTQAVAANIAKIVAEHVKRNFKKEKTTIIHGSGLTEEVDIAFIECEADREHKILAYNIYYTNILFSAMTVIKEAKVPFDWKGTKNLVDSVLNNLTIPGIVERFEKKYNRKDFLNYLNNTGLLTKDELKDKLDLAVKNFRPMFDYLYNNMDVPNITMTGYLVNSRKFVEALRKINKPMGSFPTPDSSNKAGLQAVQKPSQLSVKS